MSTESIASTMNLGLLAVCLGLAALAIVEVLVLVWGQHRAEDWSAAHPCHDRRDDK